MKVLLVTLVTPFNPKAIGAAFVAILAVECAMSTTRYSVYSCDNHYSWYPISCAYQPRNHYILGLDKGRGEA